jgi:hypothetical protein
MRNGDTFRTNLFRKDPGATAPSIGSAFTGIIGSLLAHFPNNDPAAAEMWGADSAVPPVLARMAAASTFTAVTTTDALSTGAAVKMRGASYNGKFFLTYDSAVDRTHVWDPNLSSPRVRRVGLAKPAAPTGADSGGGAPAGTRYYRVRYRIKHSTIVDAQSEASAALTFTPTGIGVTVTKPATISEQETHWVLEGSADNVTFYEISEIVVGTTTYADTATPSSYSLLPLSPVLGAYIPPISAKYVCAAFNRMLWMGGFETGALQSRVYFSPSKGTSDKGDDERIPDTLSIRNWIDLGEGTGGDGTGLIGPIYGSVYVFKYNQIRKLTPTGASTPVFDNVEISSTRGAIEQECIAVGEDDQHRECIYFLDPQVGPMVTGPTTPTEIGQGVRDLWDVVNLAATTKVGQVVDYPKLGQVWFWWATGANTEPNVLAKYTKATGGWSVKDTGGKLRLARAAVLFARTLAASMSRDKVPYTSYQVSNNVILRADTTDLDDAGTTYQAIVKSRPYAFNGGKPFRTTAPWIVAKAQDGVTLTVTVDADFGRDVRTTTISLTPTTQELVTPATRVYRKCEGLDVTDACFAQYQIGDSAAIANTWQIERMYVPVMPMATDP